MGVHDCKYLVRDGVCSGNLKVVCEYQRYIPERWDEINKLTETFCCYPEPNPNTEYVKAIRAIAEHRKELTGGKIR